jgi:UDP-glucose 4-epimerase
LSATGDYEPTELVVLGADGFIGSHVVREALSRGIGVRAICVKDTWRLDGLGSVKRVAAPRWWEPGSRRELSRLLSGAQGLALLSYVPPGDREPTSWMRHELEVNVRGVRGVAELAASQGVQVVLASSSHVYGLWHDQPVTEDAEPRPTSPYSKAKLRAEDELRQVAVGGWSLRLGTVFGPGEYGPRAVPSFIRALLRGESPVVHGDGTDVYDYVHVRDVARAFVAACLDATHGHGAPINIGSGVGRTTLEVLRTVAQAIDRPPTSRMIPSSREGARLVLRCDRARRELGFLARESFHEGVLEEARWLSRGSGTSPLLDCDAWPEADLPTSRRRTAPERTA